MRVLHWLPVKIILVDLRVVGQPRTNPPTGTPHALRSHTVLYTPPTRCLWVSSNRSHQKHVLLWVVSQWPAFLYGPRGMAGWMLEVMWISVGPVSSVNDLTATHNIESRGWAAQDHAPM